MNISQISLLNKGNFNIGSNVLTISISPPSEVYPELDGVTMTSVIIVSFKYMFTIDRLEND